MVDLVLLLIVGVVCTGGIVEVNGNWCGLKGGIDSTSVTCLRLSEGVEGEALKVVVVGDSLIGMTALFSSEATLETEDCKGG